MSVIVVDARFAGALASTLRDYVTLLSVIVATGIRVCLTVVAEGWLHRLLHWHPYVSTAIILACLHLQYIIEGLGTNCIVNPWS